MTREDKELVRYGPTMTEKVVDMLYRTHDSCESEIRTPLDMVLIARRVVEEHHRDIIRSAEMPWSKSIYADEFRRAMESILPSIREHQMFDELFGDEYGARMSVQDIASRAVLRTGGR